MLDDSAPRHLWQRRSRAFAVYRDRVEAWRRPAWLRRGRTVLYFRNVSRIRADGGDLVFTMFDGREQRFPFGADRAAVEQAINAAL